MKFHKENILLCMLIFLQHSSICSSWDYTDQKSWPETCTYGTRQSPIDLPNINRPCTNNNIFSISFKDSSEFRLELSNYMWNVVSDHVIADLIAQDVSGVVQEYQSTSFTIHSLSEHAFSSKRYDLEIQFLFVLSADTPNTTPYQKAILSVLFEKDVDNLGSELISVINNAAITKDTEKLSLDLRALIEKSLNNHTNFLTYKGSSTSPPCNEEINWYLLESPLKVSENDLSFVKNTYFGENSGYSQLNGNARDLQEVNSRVIKRICDVIDENEQPALYNVVLLLAILLVFTYLGLYFRYGKKRDLEEGDDHVFTGNSLWTLHPLYSIINIPSKDGYSRRSRISILFIDWLTQLATSSLWYSTYRYSSHSAILTVAILSIFSTLPVSFLLGLFFRRYYQRVREISRKMHSDESFIRSEKFTFLGICLGVAFIDLFMIYSLTDDLIGKLSRYTVYSFFVAIFLQECAIEPFLIYLASKFRQILPILKLRGYYFEGEITQYNIIDK